MIWPRYHSFLKYYNNVHGNPFHTTTPKTPSRRIVVELTSFVLWSFNFLNKPFVFVAMRPAWTEWNCNQFHVGVLEKEMDSFAPRKCLEPGTVSPDNSPAFISNFAYLWSVCSITPFQASFLSISENNSKYKLLSTMLHIIMIKTH